MSPTPPRRARRLSPLFLALIGFGALTFCATAAFGIYNIPSVKQRIDQALYWRIQFARAELRDLLNPPQAYLPTPEPPGAGTAQASLPDSTLAPQFEDSAPTAAPTSTAIPTVTLQSPPTATPTAAPRPNRVILTGVVHEYQRYNNCGPAAASMTMSYWGFTGDQLDAASWLKPNQGDYNVRPSEIEWYINTVEGSWLGAYYRVGGTLDLLQTLIAAGYPVIVEEGYELSDKGWMGHYLPLTGYDADLQVFYAQDSFYGPDQTVAFANLNRDWQSFNRTFIVLFPNEREAEVQALLGPYADLTGSYQIALDQSLAETTADPNNAFAWHNLGSNHNYFGDFTSAAAAFDRAREIGLPWRMLWYQSGIYRAYYNVGRYSDVVTLADVTLASMTEPNHEESLYWRGWARYALGDLPDAVNNFQRALYYNHNFADARDALTQLGQ